MPFFRTPAGKVHYLSEEDLEQGFAPPDGSAVMNDAEVAAHLHPPLSREQMIERVLTKLREMRAKVFVVLDVLRIDLAAEAVAVMASPNSTQEQKDAAAELVAKAKQTAVDLREITRTVVPAEATTERQIVAVFMTRYRQIAQAAPAPLHPTFAALAAELVGVTS